MWTEKVQSHSHTCCVRVLGLSHPVRNLLLRTRLGFHCCVNQNSGYHTLICVLKEMYGEKGIPSLSQHCRGGCSVCHLLLCLKSPFSKDMKQSMCFSAQDYPGCGTQLPPPRAFPALATSAAQCQKQHYAWSFHAV